MVLPLLKTLKRKEVKASLSNLPFFPNRGEGILECSNTQKLRQGFVETSSKGGSAFQKKGI